jgi:malic enzyme
MAVALAVAKQAQTDGVTEPCDDVVMADRIRARIWEPTYRPYVKAP